MGKALEKDRELRYQVAAEMRADLKRLKRESESGRSGSGTSSERGVRLAKPAYTPSSFLSRRALAAVGIGMLSVSAAIYWLTQYPAPGRPEIRVRQLTTNSRENPVRSSAISPDGKYLAYTDLKGMHIRLLETGQTQTIAQPQIAPGANADWYISRWFPDGTRFLANLEVSTEQNPSMWIVSLLGATARKLRDASAASSVSPDGSLIAFETHFGKAGPREIWVMGANGEQPRKLFETDENSAIGGAQFSSSGRRLLHFKSPAVPGKPGDALQSQDINGGPPVEILASQKLRDYVWSPDGRLIYSLAEEGHDSVCNFWEVFVDPNTGQVRNGPKRLSDWTGFCVDGANPTRDGKRLSFQESTRRSVAYVAGLEAKGKRIGKPNLLTFSDSENAPLDWTADSKSVIVVSNRDGHDNIFRQSIDGESEEALLPPGEDFDNPKLSPDGAWLLYVQTPPGSDPSTHRIMRIPIGGGPSEPVMQAPKDNYRCTKLPINICVFDEYSQDHRQLIFTSLDAMKGRGRELLRYDTDADSWYDWEVVSDGSGIAIRKEYDPRLDIISLHGRPRSSITVKGWNTVANLNWATNGQGFFTSGISQRGSVLLYVDLAGNAFPLWEQRGSRFAWGVPSPDGYHLAFTGMTDNANVFLTENF